MKGEAQGAVTRRLHQFIGSEGHIPIYPATAWFDLQDAGTLALEHRSGGLESGRAGAQETVTLPAQRHGVVQHQQVGAWQDRERQLDSRLEIGDMVLGFPPIPHGVVSIEPNAKLDWTSEKGRWMVPFNNLVSHYGR